MSILLNAVWQVRIFTNETVGATIQLGVNNLYYRCDAQVGGGAAEQDFINEVDTSFQAAYKAAISVGANYYGVSGRELLPTKSGNVVQNVNAGAGTVAGNMLPKQVAAVFTKHTPQPGHSGRGRVYIGFQPVAGNTAAAGIAAGQLALLDTLRSIFASGILAITGADQSHMQPVLYSKKLNAFFTVSSVTKAAIWGTQRRRGDYGRQNALPF